MDLVSEFQMKERGAMNPAVRSVCWDPLKKRLLVGTLGAEIFEVRDNTYAHCVFTLLLRKVLHCLMIFVVDCACMLTLPFRVLCPTS